MITGKGLEICDHREARSDSVQLPPQEERAHELHRQKLRIGGAQPPLANEPLHERAQMRSAAAHALEQIEAPFVGEADPIGQQHATHLLLPPRRIVVEDHHDEPHQRRPRVVNRRVDQARQSPPALRHESTACHNCWL